MVATGQFASSCSILGTNGNESPFVAMAALRFEADFVAADVTDGPGISVQSHGLGYCRSPVGVHELFALATGPQRRDMLSI